MTMAWSVMVKACNMHKESLRKELSWQIPRDTQNNIGCKENLAFQLL